MLAGLMGISAVDNTNNTLSETTDVAAINDLNIAPELSSFSKAPPSPPAAADLPAPAFSFADAKLVNGNQAELTFTDGTSWLFHTAWLHDSCRGQVRARADATKYRRFRALTCTVPARFVRYQRVKHLDRRFLSQIPSA
jgi:hypothetical protein